MGFALIVLILWGIYIFVMKKKLDEEFLISKALIPLIMICFLSTICLGINYVSSAIPSINDGIGIHNFLAGLIIGEDNWSIELFKKYFNFSVYINVILIFIYSLGTLFKK